MMQMRLEPSRGWLPLYVAATSGRRRRARVAASPVRATLAGIFLFVIGLGIAGGAFTNYRRERDQYAGWQRADGQVVQMLQPPTGRARPIVGFTAADGTRIRFTAVMPRGTGSYKTGDAVTVLYPIDEPSAARIDSPVVRWARPVYAACGSIVLMALGAYVAWYARRA